MKTASKKDGSSKRSAAPHLCSGGCKSPVARARGPLSFCAACFWLNDQLQKEGAASVAELRDRREVTLARVSDLLIRTGVEDAHALVRKLERL